MRILLTVMSTLRRQLVTLLCVTILMVSPSLAQERALFKDTAGAALSNGQSRALLNVQANSAARNVQVVAADPTALDSATVIIPLPGVGSVRVERLNMKTRSPSDYTWNGRVQSTGTQATLTIRGDSIEGAIWVGNEEFAIRPLGDGLHAIGKIETRALPTHHPRTPPVAPRGASRSSLPAPAPPEMGAAGVVVDILIAYTPEALQANSSIAQMAQSWVDTMNQSYANSNANVELRLAGTYQITGYTEPAASTGATGYEQILNDATNGTLAPMAALHTERDRVGADMVAVLVKHPSYCGLAWVDSSESYAFSVVTHTCGALVLGHELGHNFGSWHDHVTSPQTTPYAYGHGYFYGTGSTGWRTIMSYSGPCNGCPRIPYFANPSLNYNSVPMGTAAVNDVARVHRERVATVAAFRTPQVTNTPAAITSPTTGASINPTTTFAITTGSGVSSRLLYVGTSFGASDIYNAGVSETSATVSNIPGGQVHVTLWSLIGGTWQFNTYAYTGAGPVMTSPAKGSTINPTATFTWSSTVSVSSYVLYVGTSLGASDVFSSGIAGTTATVPNIPGGTVHVTLWSLISGVWHYSTYTYTGAGPKITSPVASSTINPATTFTWSPGIGVTTYVLYVGTSFGASNVFSSGVAGTSATVANIPGGTIHVTLWSLIGGSWYYNTYTYTGAGPTITSPANGSTIGASTTFSWTPGIGATSYLVYVGTSYGASNVFSSGVAGTSITVSNIPAGTIHVTLWSLIGGSWQYNTYVYSRPGPEPRQSAQFGHL